MNIFITGATGFVGSPLTHRLQRTGHQLTAFVRTPETAAQILGPRVELVSDRAPDPVLRDALSRADAIINLAGAPVTDGRWTEKRRRILRDSRIGVTRRLVDALESLQVRPATFLSASAVGYYGIRPKGELSEASPGGSDFLANLCADWESEAFRATALGLRVVTLRTAIILGLGGGALQRLLPLFRSGLGGRLGDGEQPMPWIHLQDVLQIITAALKDQDLQGPVNLVSPGLVTNREFTRELSVAVGKRAPVPVPGFALRVALGQAAENLLGGQKAVPRKLLRHGYRFHYPALAPALQSLVGPDRSISITTAEQLPSSPYLRQHGAHYELRQETLINAPRPEVFAFFSRAENLGLLTPPDVEFQIHSEQPIEMLTDAEITYSITLGLFRVHWRTKIERWEPGRSFVDVQTEGPYRSWWHEHRFQAVGDQTVMYDRVLYSPPLGPLGRAAHRLKIAPKLREIFSYRRQAIELQFGPPTQPDQSAAEGPRYAPRPPASNHPA